MSSNSFRRHSRVSSRLRVGLVAGLFLFALCLAARADMTIYDDALENDWQNWSTTPYTVNLQGTAYVHSGLYAAEANVNPGGDTGNLIFSHDAASLNMLQFSSLDFWINGGATGGQPLAIALIGENVPALVMGDFQPLPANSWQHMNFSLAGLQGQPTVFVEFVFLTAGGQAVPTFYIDDMKLVSIPEPVSAALLATGWLAAWAIRRKNFSPGR